MKKQLNQLKDFHVAFKVTEGTATVPGFVSKKTSDLRFKLMDEENNEYLEACEENDLPGIADALGDQLYILLGTMNCHGMQDKIEEVFDAIHTANMSKLNSDGEPIVNGVNGHDPNKPAGKVLKPEGWKAPDIESIINPK
ncbi:nucleotide pyrophosphohydrolase [Maribacter phage Colly_1]|uniref:Nucleoside triphosphate pyrophosphohydrolase family protein n=1 Tax=Maribacter phage Colly_1 TaxID=2745691 RepID=A0A8E4XVQ1_9CAUD|nr:nucleotide pyrophosphohydrolase [Maribacter phage Colly_1]QQO97324.1 nucleoside triphosphate pyrophosphohydrolase family protein [Maribacter phage Colly_1]